MALFLLLAGVGRVVDLVVDWTDRIPRLHHEAGDWLLRKLVGQ